MSSTRSSQGRRRPAPRHAPWKEIRQAARTARSENVTVKLCPNGTVVVSPLRPLDNSTAAAGDRRCAPEKTKKTTPNSPNPEPMVTDGEGAEKLSRKQRLEQRAVARQQAAQARQLTQAATRPPQPQPQPDPAPPDRLARVLPRWGLLTNRALWQARKETCTRVVRERREERKLEARRKLRELLRPWALREWARPQIEPPPISCPAGSRPLLSGLQVLGMRSRRDEYILARARALLDHLSIPHRLTPGLPVGVAKHLWSWLGFRYVAAFHRKHPATASPGDRSRKKSRRGGVGRK